MKKLLIPACLAAFLTLGTSCGNSGGSDNNGDSTGTDMNNGAATTATDTTANTNANADTSSMASTTNNAADGDFISDAASGGMMEVQLGKTAETNAASSKVKDFGRMMVTDHSKANDELKSIVSKKGITLPAAPLEKQQNHINDLQSKTGADFDKAYVDMMVDDHKEDIDKFQDEAKNGKDPDIKAFASKTLPVLQKHLRSIQAIQAGMKK